MEIIVRKIRIDWVLKQLKGKGYFVKCLWLEIYKPQKCSASYATSALC